MGSPVSEAAASEPVTLPPNDTLGEINLPNSNSVGCGKNPEHPEKSYFVTQRMCKFNINMGKE